MALMRASKVAGVLLLAGACAFPSPAAGAAQPTAPVAVRHLTRADLVSLRSVEAHPAARASAVARRRRDSALPTFSSSFTTGGATYPYTMLGVAPESGKTVELKTVIVPLRMVFTGFTTDAVFDPSFAVVNIRKSPIYNTARFINGRGQFVDQMQRATFFNRMDRRHRWHTLLDEPDTSRTFTITVTPQTGQLDEFNGALLGNMNIGDFDAQLHAILPSLHLRADETPLFITQSVTADALGYHDAFNVPDGLGGQRLQTLMWSSWLDPAQVGTLLGDITTLNHEAAEWVNDPFIDNAAPLWAFPPFNTVCGDNPFVEVGDPQGNGPDFQLFPAVAVQLAHYTYHLQDLALLQWFTRETPSSAYRGWYAFPDPTQLTSPSVDCP